MLTGIRPPCFRFSGPGKSLGPPQHFGLAGLFYAEGVRALLSVVLVAVLAVSAWAQDHAGRLPRFEDYPVTEFLKQTPVEPIIQSPEERRFRTVIRRGVSKGWGIQDGTTGREITVPGPNFAGRYIIVTWGCGSPCLMAAIVDAKSGRVFPPPFHHGPGHSYFQVPWAFPMDPPLDYRLRSRLLIARICENTQAVRVGGSIGYQTEKCGAHYFLMGEDGLKLIHRTLEK